MAGGTLLTVLSNIPWGQVVDNAPKIADAASKLWNSVNSASSRKKQGAASAAGGADAATTQAKPDETQRMQARVLALEESVRTLQEELQSSSALIKALAEQNTLLVERVELNRRRLVRVVVAVAAGGVVLFSALIYLELIS